MPTLLTRIRWLGAGAKLAAQWLRRLPRAGVDPSLLLVGTQRAGSTSLFRYLAASPGFAPAQRKEVRFFHIDANYARGLAWYRKFFDGRRPDAVHFEATPVYLYHPEAALRIHAHYPDARIVIMLREPVARAYSAWNMYYHWARTGRVPLNLYRSRKQPGNQLYSLFFQGRPPTFGEYIDHELRLMEQADPPHEPGIIRRGIYADQVARYLELFGPSRVLVLGFSELATRPETVVERVVAFARGREGAATGVARAHNAGTYADECPRAEAERLATFYAPHNERLWARLGYRVDW